MTKLIIFEGMDFVGKTTQVARLMNEFNVRGLSARTLSMLPAGRIREELLSNSTLTTPTRALLYKAAAQQAHRMLMQHLDSGDLDYIVMDRGPLTYIAYQGVAEGNLELIEAIEPFFPTFPKPDYEILLTLTVAQMRERQQMSRELDVVETRDDAFFEKLRQAFFDWVDLDNPGLLKVDASLSIDEVAALIQHHIFK